MIVLESFAFTKGRFLTGKTCNDIAIIQYLYGKNNTFATLGEGYYIVENGSTPLKGAFDSEIDEVKNFLEGGVYYA